VRPLAAVTNTHFTISRTNGRKDFSEEHIIAVLKEGEGGVPVAEIGGLDVSDAKRLRQLEWCSSFAPRHTIFDRG
jgi:hypothetical protein